MTDLLPPENDHDAIANMWPRLGAVERQITSLENRLDTALAALREDVRAIEARLTDKLETSQREMRTELAHRLDRIDTHLDAQDQVVGTVREEVARGSGRWPASAIGLGSALVTALVGLLAAWLTHARF
jgi:hypothetical protein